MEFLRETIIQYLQFAAVEVEELLELTKDDLGVGGARESLIVVDQLQEFIERLFLLEIGLNSKAPKTKELRATFETIRAEAEAVKIPADVMKKLQAINKDLDITEKVDEALLLLDDIKRAKVLSSNNKKIFCKNLLIEAKIKLNLLDNETRASKCLEELLDIAQTEGFNEEEWYKEALEVLEKIKHKDDEKPKAEIVDLLSEEMKLLDDSADLSLGELIEFLFKNFPPKHKQNPKKPEMKDPTNTKQKKRAYYILCSLYHPDKVDRTEHGVKYKVLCEEISKRINQRFGNI